MLTAALGLMVLVGWYGHLPVLVQVHPAFVPMQYNTALGFLLSGAGLLVLANGRQRPALVCGATVCLIGLATLIEYGAGVELGVDQFFMEHRITVKSSHPGRMAPTTALSFVLGGIVLMSLGAWPRRRQMFSGIIASFVFALGMGTFLGYMLGAEAPYGLSNLTYMAIHTAAGFVVLGTGIFVYVLRSAMMRHGRLPRWVPVPVGICADPFTGSVAGTDLS